MTINIAPLEWHCVWLSTLAEKHELKSKKEIYQPLREVNNTVVRGWGP